MRQVRVQGVRQLARRDAAARLEVGHLTERVHARVRPPCAEDRRHPAGDRRDGLRQLTLHRRLAVLHLPAEIVRAVVLDGDFHVSKRNSLFRADARLLTFLTFLTFVTFVTFATFLSYFSSPRNLMALP